MSDRTTTTFTNSGDKPISIDIYDIDYHETVPAGGKKTCTQLRLNKFYTLILTRLGQQERPSFMAYDYTNKYDVYTEFKPVPPNGDPITTTTFTNSGDKPVSIDINEVDYHNTVPANGKRTCTLLELNNMYTLILTRLGQQKRPSYIAYDCTNKYDVYTEFKPVTLPGADRGEDF